MKTLEILRRSLEIGKTLTSLSGNPEILLEMSGIAEIREIFYAILGSERPLDLLGVRRVSVLGVLVVPGLLGVLVCYLCWFL